MSKKELDLNKELSFVTSKVIWRVIDWKRKRQRWKKLKFVMDIFTLILMGVILYNLSNDLSQASSMDQFYSILFSSGVQKAFVILVPILIVWKFSNDKYRKVDDDYEVLRKEVIDRADELWFHFPEDFASRQDVLEYIHKTYDVNLFYKKK